VKSLSGHFSYLRESSEAFTLLGVCSRSASFDVIIPHPTLAGDTLWRKSTTHTHRLTHPNTPADIMDSTRRQLIKQRSVARGKPSRIQNFIAAGDQKRNDIQVRFNKLADIFNR
jgi:hypothetical protein